jgi:hypothetical protein
MMKLSNIHVQKRFVVDIDAHGNIWIENPDKTLTDINQMFTADDSTYRELWLVSLSKYERDNVLAALVLMGAYANVWDEHGSKFTALKPFDMLNNGDWLSQVSHKLRSNDMHRPETISPNCGGIDMLKDRIDNEWLHMKQQIF